MDVLNLSLGLFEAGFGLLENTLGTFETIFEFVGEFGDVPTCFAEGFEGAGDFTVEGIEEFFGTTGGALKS